MLRLIMMVTFHAKSEIIFLKHEISTGFPPNCSTCGTWKFQREEVISPEMSETAYFERISGRN